MATFAETQSFDSVRMIETNDPVLGGNPEISGQVNSPANYAYRALVNRTAWLKAQLEALVIPPAPSASSTTVAGIVRLSTIREAETGTLTTVAVTPAGLQAALDALDIGGVDFASNPEVQSGTVTDKAVSPAGLSSRTATENRTGLVKKATSSQASNRTDNQVYMTPLRTDAAMNARNATEGRRGSIEIATTNEATGGTDDVRAMTSEKTLALLRHSNAQASTTRRGTVELATAAEANAGTNTTKVLTPATNPVAPAATATISVSSGTITVRTNIVIGKLLFMRIENTGSSSISDNVTWTLGGGAWRFLSVSYEDHHADIDIIIQMGRLNSSQNTGLKNVTHNSNNTTFNTGSAMANSEVVSIIAVLNS